MYCKLCGEHLYKEMSFKNIFKLNYSIHDECENSINWSNDYMTFPFLDKLILFDYLFEKRFADSDEVFLYMKYSYILLERMIANNQWSIVIIVDVGLDDTTLILVTKLADEAVLILNIFNENFM